MNGGYFDYNQRRISDIAFKLVDAINDHQNDYSKETIKKLKRTLHVLNLATTMVQRIDWLLSGDDSEESFHRRWDEEIFTIEKLKCDR